MSVPLGIAGPPGRARTASLPGLPAREPRRAVRPAVGLIGLVPRVDSRLHQTLLPGLAREACCVRVLLDPSAGQGTGGAGRELAAAHRLSRLGAELVLLERGAGRLPLLCVHAAPGLRLQAGQRLDAAGVLALLPRDVDLRRGLARGLWALSGWGGADSGAIDAARPPTGIVLHAPAPRAAGPGLSDLLPVRRLEGLLARLEELLERLRRGLATDGQLRQARAEVRDLSALLGRAELTVWWVTTS